MNVACRELYKSALAAELNTLSRLVNELICNGTLCPYMAGSSGSGVPVSESSVLRERNVFVAIDTASLTEAVTFDVFAATVCQQQIIYTKKLQAYNSL